jgi:RNA polymerase sigma factor (sigma-70 family)
MERTSEEVLAKYFETKSSDLLAILYERMHLKLCTVASRILHCSEDGEDIVQDVFCKLQEMEPQSICSAESFLFKMTQNAAIDFQRHRTNDVLPLENSETLQPTDRIEDDPENQDDMPWHFDIVDKKTLPAPAEGNKKELSEEVDAVMKVFPERQREAIHLYHARGLTAAETGEILGIPEDAVEKMIRVGIGALRDTLLEPEEQPQPRPHVRPVRAIDPDSGAVVIEYGSMKEALKAGGSGRHLRNALKKGTCYRGYRWDYSNAV